MSSDGAGSRPPRLAEALLSRSLPDGERSETILGDLHEIYLHKAAAGGHGSAARWYWRQAVTLSLRHAVAGPRAGGRGPARIDALRWHLRLAVRALVRSPGFSVPALVILTIGLTAATTMFTLVDSIALRPLDYEDPGRLVLLCEHHPALSTSCVASPANAVDLATPARSLSDWGIARGWSLSIEEDDGRYGARGGLATGGFFSTLGVRPQLGRIFSADETGPDADDVLILSHAFWTAHYGGDPEVIGQVVRVDGKPSTVIGVLPRDWSAPLDLAGVEVWKPPHVRLLDPEVRGWRGWRVVGRLSQGIDRDASTRELATTYEALSRLHDEIDAEWSVRLTPLRTAVLGDTRVVLYGLLAAAGLLLIVVCANVANLLLARGIGRQQELAVRAAMGASRGRLIAGLLIESTLISTAAGALAVVLASGMTRAVLAIAPRDIPRLDAVVFDARAFAFAGVVALLTVVLAGVAPALRVTADDLGRLVKSGIGRGSDRSASRMRDGLVVAELAICVMLVATAGLLTRSLSGYLSWDPGFDRDGLVAMSIFFPTDGYRTRAELVPAYLQVEEAAASVPGVAMAATVSAGPLLGGGDGSVEVEPQGWGTRSLPSAEWFDAGPGYFRTLGLPVRSGREFTERDAQGTAPVLVVNETFARMAWPDQDAVGRSVSVPDRGDSFDVVGVVADVPSLVPGDPTPARMYWPNRQYGRWGTFLLVRTAGDAATVGGEVATALASAAPELSIGTPRTVASLEASALVRPRFQASVLVAFALTAMILAVGGVYSVVAFSVERRAREVGIRIALGADGPAVVRMIVQASLLPALAGIVLGLLGALASGSLLRGIIHGVSPSDPLTLGTAAVMLALASMLAALAPALRATHVDPLSWIDPQ